MMFYKQNISPPYLEVPVQRAYTDIVIAMFILSSRFVSILLWALLWLYFNMSRSEGTIILHQINLLFEFFYTIQTEVIMDGPNMYFEMSIK